MIPPAVGRRLQLCLRHTRRARCLDRGLDAGARYSLLLGDRHRMVGLPDSISRRLRPGNSRRVDTTTARVRRRRRRHRGRSYSAGRAAGPRTIALLLCAIRESANPVSNILVILKIGVVVLVIAVGLFYVNPDHWTPLIPANTGTPGEYGWSGVMRGAAVVFYAYLGFDIVASAAQEARDPQRDAPFAIVASLLLQRALYPHVAGDDRTRRLSRAQRAAPDIRCHRGRRARARLAQARGEYSGRSSVSPPAA